MENCTALAFLCGAEDFLKLLMASLATRRPLEAATHELASGPDKNQQETFFKGPGRFQSIQLRK